MKNTIPRTDVEHWAVLRTAVRSGSFAKAALEINRSQSSVSYAIAELQKKLNVDLIKTVGRRAVLTKTGERLLMAAIPLIDGLNHLEERASLMASGQTPSLRILCDCLFPRDILFSAITGLQNQHPQTEISVHEFARKPISHFKPESWDVAIGYWDDSGLNATPLVDIALRPIVRADHPIANVTKSELEEQLSTVPRVVIDVEDKVNHDFLLPGQWRVNSLDAAVAAIRSGKCYGHIPAHIVREDLQAGRLIEIPTQSNPRLIPLVLALGRQFDPMPHADTLADLVRAEVAPMLGKI
ncbi:MAG: LysR family transcriptional regulator [Rhodospirillales bacterium]|nr:LysR family transcriptional regulator [Rhodospirillales bacterium]